MEKAKKYIIYLIYILIIIFILYLLNDFIKPLFISLVMAYILHPFKKHLEARGIPKRVATLVSVMIVVIIIGFTLLILIPRMVKEIFAIVSNIKLIEESLARYLKILDRLPAYLKGGIYSLITRFQNYITMYLNKLFIDTLSISKDVPIYILIPIFIYYFLLDEEYFKKQFLNLIPIRIRDIVLDLSKEIDNVIGNYIKGQIILSFIISIFTFIILVIFKIRFPLFIAIINGFANVIPYFGPILGYVPAVLIALTESINKAIFITIFFFILQEVESGIIAPKILGDSLGLHPVYIIIILLIGGKFFGAIGLLIAVPIAGIVKVTYNYLMRKIF